MKIEFRTAPDADGMGRIVVDGRQYWVPAKAVEALADPYLKGVANTVEYFSERAKKEGNTKVVEWFDAIAAEAERERAR